MKRRFLTHAPQAAGPLSGSVVILWHGAGGDVDQAHLVAVARAAADEGAFVARARFGYRMAGRKGPDRMPKLLLHARETIEEVVARSGIDTPRLLLGGRSMGGRAASMLVAEGQHADGLLLLSYPLHPPGKPDQLRDAHLPAVVCPMLFIAGDRDNLSRLDLLVPVVERLVPRATLEVFSGANHGFSKVPAADVVVAAQAWWKGL